MICRPRETVRCQACGRSARARGTNQVCHFTQVMVGCPTMVKKAVYLLLVAMLSCQHQTQPRMTATAVTAAAPLAATATGSSVIFDGEAIRGLIRWARSDSIDLPSAWRDSKPFALTREWARWSGQSDPDQGVERMLRELVSDKARTPASTRMGRAERLLEAILDGRNSFLQRALPHLQAYLPPNTEVRGQVLFAVFTPPYAFAWRDGSIVVNVTAAFWKWNPDKVFNLLVHELYHNGFGVHRRGSSPQEANDRNALVENLLWQTQNEGMATYVAYRARPTNLEIEDYRLLDDPAEVRVRFELLQRLLADIDGANETTVAGMRDRLWADGTSKRAFYIVGASMARRIESERGRAALVQTVRDGPRAFVAEYMATMPPPELELRLRAAAAEISSKAN